MSLNSQVTILFKELMTNNTIETRRLFYLGHPTLASQSSVEHLSIWLATNPNGVDKNKAQLALTEL
uniref:hypothetical protein n=1 Tax=Crenothrix polyspora TaxID=360316 RepID=UPI000B364978|nr:hypothetical protein [Crenothrix polyspora]